MEGQCAANEACYFCCSCCAGDRAVFMHTVWVKEKRARGKRTDLDGRTEGPREEWVTVSNRARIVWPGLWFSLASCRDGSGPRWRALASFYTSTAPSYISSFKWTETHLLLEFPTSILWFSPSLSKESVRKVLERWVLGVGSGWVGALCSRLI